MQQLDQYRSQVIALVDTLKAQGFDNDEELILDTIEGETDVLEAVSRLLRWAGNGQAMAAGLKQYEADIRARRDRYDARKDAAKKAIFRLMQDMGIKKLERPEGTMSVSDGKPKVSYAPDFDAASLPDALRRVKYEPDAAAIKAAIDEGQTIDGVYLTNAEPVITLRVK